MFHSWDIQIFVFPSSPLFSPVKHYFGAWSKINLKICDVINCLNKILITHFVWHHEKEKGMTLKLFPLIEYIKKGTFLWKSHADNVLWKLVPYPFLILVNNPKQPLLARNSLKILKEDYQKALRKLILFVLLNPVPFKEQSYQKQKKSGTSHSSGYKTSSKKFLYELYIIWPCLMM